MPVENLFTNSETDVTSLVTLVHSRTHGEAPSKKASIIEYHHVIGRCPNLLELRVDRTDMHMTPLTLAHAQRFMLSLFYLKWSLLRADGCLALTIGL